MTNNSISWSWSRDGVESGANACSITPAVNHPSICVRLLCAPAPVLPAQSLVWRLFPGRFGDEASFLPRLRRTAEVAHAVLAVEEPPHTGANDYLGCEGGSGADDSEVGDDPFGCALRGCPGK